MKNTSVRVHSVKQKTMRSQDRGYLGLDWDNIGRGTSKGSGNTPFIDLGVGYASMLSL